MVDKDNIRRRLRRQKVKAAMPTILGFAAAILYLFVIIYIRRVV